METNLKYDLRLSLIFKAAISGVSDVLVAVASVVEDGVGFDCEKLKKSSSGNPQSLAAGAGVEVAAGCDGANPANGSSAAGAGAAGAGFGAKPAKGSAWAEVVVWAVWLENPKTFGAAAAGAGAGAVATELKISNGSSAGGAAVGTSGLGFGTYCTGARSGTSVSALERSLVIARPSELGRISPKPAPFRSKLC